MIVLDDVLDDLKAMTTFHDSSEDQANGNKHTITDGLLPFCVRSPRILTIAVCALTLTAMNTNSDSWGVANMKCVMPKEIRPFEVIQLFIWICGKL